MMAPLEAVESATDLPSPTTGRTGPRGLSLSHVLRCPSTIRDAILALDAVPGGGSIGFPWTLLRPLTVIGLDGQIVA